MFIELTDHLRCPAAHDEAYLVLLPERMAGRSVLEGNLGCPVCGAVVPVMDGEARFAAMPPAGGTTALGAEAIAAFLGLSGPGGYVALAGAVAATIPALAPLLEGVHLVAVNPPAGMAADAPASVLRSARWPVKASALRGVVVSGEAAADPEWLAAAMRSVLPGRRAVVEGPRWDLPGFECLAESGAVWVAARR